MTMPVVAIFLAKPGAEEALERLFRDAIPATLEEDGCISYQLNRDLNQPRRFVWTEEWQSRALIEKHRATRQNAELLSNIRDLVESSEVFELRKVDGGLA
ncbi:putative quinol monooxygenase [Mesorhizobium sp. XAP10]|uniref:putative quinol monooxygenase n=1 Tax=unclassified Mesorhizobium TaxID=325217 RepID=UPI0023DFEB95|nr:MULTISPECIES: putative quinol monooxygenase [unclassified Mesorhizobium]MDF3154534.1 putative quinol monooxygenase [Mesorhizobium sp. XAP10]MDF3247916.1 putative quinol monooxygenase [Mesorhizobium sp. XAP4]